MRKQVCIGLISMVGLGAGSLLFGCGAKFVSTARATRFEQAPKGHQESILIYENPSSDVPAALARVAAAAALQRAGYRPRTVDNAADFEKNLRDAKWDLVVAGANDAEAAKLSYPSAKILLVALRMAGPHLKQAQKQFPLVLTKPAPNNDSLVRTIGDALRS